VASTPLGRAAATTVERLGVGPDEAFLVVYNVELEPIAEAIAAAARARSDRVAALVFATLSRHGEEPPAEVAAALAEAAAAALLTTFSLSHTRARLEATRRGVRVASMPDMTRDMFERTLPVDYARLESVGRALAAALGGAERCHISSPGGSDVELMLGGRDGRSDDGDLRAAGAFGNLPAGEAYIAPREHEGGGTIVFDGSIASFGLLAEPLRITLEDGRLVSAAGGAAAEWLTATLDAGGANGRFVAELGIGTNPAARLTGKILEDEKVEGTVHLAFGTNTGIGGENEASVHVDGLIRDPTVALDGRVIMRAGQLVR
jgi:leucyl aminopeptidase (aminopeptidase T)